MKKSYKEIPISRESDPQLTPEMLEDIKREWREREEAEKQQKAQQEESTKSLSTSSHKPRPTEPTIPPAEAQARQRVRKGITSIFNRAAERGSKD